MGTVRSGSENRKEETAIIRLRIGHRNLNSTLYIIGKHPTWLCEQCLEPETVDHVLISCRKDIPEWRDMEREEGKEHTGEWKEWARQEVPDQFFNNCIDGEDLTEWIM